MGLFGVSTTSFSTRNLKELFCLHAGLLVHSAKVSMTLVWAQTLRRWTTRSDEENLYVTDAHVYV